VGLYACILAPPLDALDKTEKESNPDGDPKCVPLASLPVVPQLGNGLRLRLIERFFQDDKPIMPNPVFFDLSIVIAKAATVQDSRVKFLRALLLLIPFLSVPVCLREEKSKSP
jgi:hypothetical protein